MTAPTSHPLPLIEPRSPQGGDRCACSADGGLERVTRLAATPPPAAGLDPGEDPHLSGFRPLLEREVDRRTAIGGIAAGLMAGLGLVQTACNPMASGEAR